ncbi:lymphocyte cytosolic protein 2 isoform X3 [Silurus asotus]|uniref:Lymphocyte cytosolic protein 2 isoform X3 n=1 Tax=Silurus asotus TaxID=30991 RepID=A0AAD5ASW9_SILAS|nr:lymphocyte cytosolic protein 2 isoform X3 [Silurus asotus]
MSFDSIPSKSEVMGWDSNHLADFLRRESDDDYESPNSNDEGEGSGGDYESAADGGVDSDNDYEPPPSEPPEDIQHHQICVAKHSNSEYIDRSAVKTQPPVPPARPGPGPGPPLPAMGRPSVPGPASPFLTPSMPGIHHQDHNHTDLEVHLMAMRGGSARIPPQQPMRPSDMDATGEDMDTAWYVGRVTRGQAEGNLRRVNRDGAFLVRDSSKGSTTQPYTLMVLYQEKVFNIQIRKAQDGYLLGTGLKSNEVFRSVGEIIRQHTQMALLLIDAKNRGTGQQNQCTLLHPAGF